MKARRDESRSHVDVYIYIYAQAQTKNQAFARAISPRSGSSISVNRIRRRQSGATAASHLLRGTRNVLTAVPHRGLTDTGCTHRCAIHPSWSPRSLPKVPRPGPRQAADAPGRRHRPPSPSHEAFVMKGWREWRDDQSDAGRPGRQVLEVHVFSVGEEVIR